MHGQLLRFDSVVLAAVKGEYTWKVSQLSIMRTTVNGALRVINKALPKSLVAIAIREDCHRTYAKYFLPCLTAVNMDKRGLDRFELLVPPSLCRKKVTTSSSSTTDDAYLATSSLLAIYDEMDAHSFISRDKTGRGGVSVELTFDLYEEIRPWTRLIMEIKTEKQGRYVGFSSIEVKNSDTGKIVARGNHTKFLHHGLWWNIMHGPILGPLIYSFYYRFRYGQYSTPMDKILSGQSSAEDAESVARSYPLFQTKEELFHTNFSSLRLDNSTYTFDSEDADTGDKVMSHQYSLNILPQTKNYIGLMHGGGVAGAIEQACYMFKFQGTEAEAKRSQLRLTRMHIKYMNATKDDVVVETHDDKLSQKLTLDDGSTVFSKTKGSMIDKKTGSPNVYFSCTWGLL